MAVMSALEFTAVNPNNVVAPAVAGDYRIFISDGTVYTGTGGNPSINVLGTYMKMSSTGAITALLPPAVTTEDIQDAVGAFLTDTGVIDFTYNDAGNVETATIVAGSVTDAMLVDVPQATIKGRAAGAGTGSPQPLTRAQVLTILALASSDLSDFTEASQDVIGALLADSNTIDYTYDDAGNAETVEYRIPVTSVTGASKVYATSDHGKYIRRSHTAGAAMTDTLPTTPPNGYFVKVQNLGTATTETITFSLGAGATIGELGATTYVLKYGCRQTFVYDAANNRWSFDAGNGNLLKTYTGAAAGDLVTFLDSAGINTAKATGKNVLDAGNGKYGNVHIKDFGGDPTNATSSRTALDAAIAFLVALCGGGVVWFGPGSYNFGNTPYLLANAHVSLKGTNRYNCNITTTSTTTDIIQIGQYYNTIEDLTFIGPGSGENPTKTAGFAINGNGAGFPANTEIKRCTFFYQFSCINLANSLMNVEDIECKFFKGVAITVDHNSDHLISKVICNNNAAFLPVGGAGIRVLATASLQMTALNIISSNFCLDIAPGVGVTTPSIKGVNCFFDTSVVGLNMTSAGSMLRSEFTNCWFSSMTTAGIRLNPTTAGGVNGVTFVNCDLYNNVGGTTGTGIDTNTNVGKWKAMGCSIAQWATGINLVAGTAHYPTIVGNTIGAVSAFTANTVGIAIGAGTFKGLTIQSNDMADNTTILTDASAVGFQKLINDNLGLPVPASPLTTATLLPITTVTKVANSMFIPANTLRVGTVIRATAILSKVTATADATATTRLTYNTTDVSTTALATMTLAGTAAVGQARVMYEFSVRTIGAAGTATACITLNNLAATGVANNNSQVAIVAAAAINTTVDNYLGVWGSAAVASDHRYESVFWEVISQ